MARSAVLIGLSSFLGLFFIFIGSMKITPNINWEMHREIRRNFFSYARVFPWNLVSSIKLSPTILRQSVGWTEVCCGTTLLLIPGRIKQLANACLLVLCCGAIYTHSMLWDPFERMAPSLFFTLLLLCRMVVFYQVQNKERILEEEKLLKARREKETRKAQTPATKERVGAPQSKPPAAKKGSKKKRRKGKKQE